MLGRGDLKSSAAQSNGSVVLGLGFWGVHVHVLVS